MLTYYFPPCNATAGYRPFSWAKEFSGYGMNVTVVTRNWKSSDNNAEAFRSYNGSPSQIINENGFRTIFLPYLPARKRIIGEKVLAKTGPIKRLYYLFLLLFGNTNIDMDARAAFSGFLNKHLEKEKYDLIIVSAPPFNLIRLAKELSDKFTIPYIVDFRDLWNNDELKKDFKNKNSPFSFKIIKNYIGKWISKAKLVVVATPPMIGKIKQLKYKKDIKVVLNGFEKYLFRGEQDKGIKNDKLIISCIGTLYVAQELDVFMNGFFDFLKELPQAKIQLRFIGTGFNKDVETFLRKKIPPQYIYISDRVSRTEAIQEIQKADILYYPAWKGYNGIITTKIFDYLASRRNILIAPGDDSSISELVKTTRTGQIAETAEAVNEQLKNWYYEWEKKGRLDYCGEQQIIDQYSRENQAKHFYSFITGLVYKQKGN